MVFQSIVGSVMLIIAGSLCGMAFVWANKRGIREWKQNVAFICFIVALSLFVGFLIPKASVLLLLASFLIPMAIVLAKKSKIV